MSGNRGIAQIRPGGAAAPREAVPMDTDMLHAMSARDDALVADEIMSGSSEAFTYSFKISDKTVQGVSVVGARHLAVHYGGLKHRLVASISKAGPRFVFTTYPGGGVPALDAKVASIEDMADEPDFYTVITEITDIKTGLTEQAEVTELRFEKKSRKNKKEGDPDEFYERPHYQRIAQSKAFRNNVLAILPQDVVEKFKQQSIAAKHNVDLTRDLLEEKRDGIVRYAIENGVPVDRRMLLGLDFNQIAGLGAAARVNLDAFKHALAVVGAAGSYAPLREIEGGKAEEPATQPETPVPGAPPPGPEVEDPPPDPAAAPPPAEAAAKEERPLEASMPGAGAPDAPAAEEKPKRGRREAQAAKPAPASSEEPPGLFDNADGWGDGR